MSDKTELQKVSEEIMRFMRGNYAADEVGDGKDTLRFKRGGKTILTIYIREGRYDFHIILGKAEREKFEQQRSTFSKKVNDIYDNTHTYHDGKWLLVPVSKADDLDDIKALTLFKKKPNRKPLPSARKLVGRCGNRCDLCIHYTGETSISAEQMLYAKACVDELYGSVTDPDCDGCHCIEHCDNETMQCAKDLGLSNCMDCVKFQSCTMHAGVKPEIHTRTITADQVTWAILPYVRGQYGN